MLSKYVMSVMKMMNGKEGDQDAGWQTGVEQGGSRGENFKKKSVIW